MLMVMKALKDEWYVVRKVYKFTDFKRFLVSSYIACLCYPNI